MSRLDETRSGWVAVEGRVIGNGTPKAVLFEFALSLYNGKKPQWIPRKCFKSEGGRFWIAFWFHKQLVEKWELGEENVPKRTTKKELCEKFRRRIEADESFSKPEPKSEPKEREPRFYGNVDDVLSKILN